MSLKINTNFAALNAQKNLRITDDALTKSIEKLTTGKQINTAGDNASGMSIADGLKSNSLSLGQAKRNVSDAISIMQVADGALEEAVNVINSIKQKAIQSAQDGQSLEARQSLQADVTRLLEDLDIIARTTNFNGKRLLSGNFTNKQFQIGAGAGEVATLSIGSALTTDIGHVNTSGLKIEGDGGRVRLGIYSAAKGETFFLEEVDVGYYGHLSDGKEKSMQALADVINKSSDDFNITAYAKVVSTSSSLISDGQTESTFKINGIAIGEIVVKNGDQGNNLINAINTQSTGTGVRAAKNNKGQLVLTSVDGRAIKIEGESITNNTNTGINAILGGKAGELSTLGEIVMHQNGAARILIDNIGSGNSVNVTGTGVEFTRLNIQENSKLAGGTLIDGNSILKAGYTIGQDIGIDTDAALASNVALETLFGAANLTTTTTSTFKTGSIIETGSTFAANSVLGGLTTTSAQISGITNGIIASNSTIKNASIIGSNSILGANFTTTTTGTISGLLKAGTTINANTTAGTSRTVINKDGVLDTSTTLTIIGTGSSFVGATAIDNLTLTGDGTSTIGSLLVKAGYTDTNIIVDHTGNRKINITGNGSLKNASFTNVATGSIIAAESKIGQELIVSGDTITTQNTELAGLTTLETATILSVNSHINKDIVTNGTTTNTVNGTYTKGSIFTLANTKITAGSTIGADTTIADNEWLQIASNTNFEIKSGTVLETDADTIPSSVLGNGSDIGGTLTLAEDEIVGANKMKIAAGSTLYKGTTIQKGTYLLNDFVATDGQTYKAFTKTKVDFTLASGHTLKNYQVLEEGSKILAQSVLKPQAQGLTYAKMTVGDEVIHRLSQINVLDQEGSQITIAATSAAIVELNKVRADIGAVQQQLVVTEANIQTTQINLAAAESTIRDVDFAAESSNLTRLKILAQAGTYALQQANASAETVLKLLQ